MTRSTPSPMQHADISAQVQHNCHLSDATYARDYSLCIYLLKMREFYRWEQGFGFRDPLPKEPLGEWLSAREALWQNLEGETFRPMKLGQEAVAPFDSETINEQLGELGLVYSGGYCGSKPHFFLAELEHREESQGSTIYLAGRELARELTAPPAFSLGNTIFLRRESLRRMIWEKLEEWGWQDPQRAIARAAGFYDFDNHFDSALEAMTNDEIDTLLTHELGEIAVGQELGADWEALLATLPRSRAEYLLRAIRDHLVDCRYTLPKLLAEDRPAALHFYMANFTTLRKEIFPALGEAYQRYLEGDQGKTLRETCARGSEHWYALAQQALTYFERYHDEPKRLLSALNQLDKDGT